MIRLGEVQTLEVYKKTDFGFYLKDYETKEDDGILLPKREAAEDTDISDHIQVFVYKDSEDRWICTTRKPYIQMGELKRLKVAQVTKIGAFMDWGLMKDVLLPFKQQLGKVEEGKSYLVGLYIDKSERICATMKINSLLSLDHSFEQGEKSSGLIYNVHDELGVFVAVEGKYPGLIPSKEITQKYRVGEMINFKIGKVHKDGKLDLTLHSGGFTQMEEDEAALYQLLEDNGGFLPINDKTDKDIINKTTSMSKRAFKRSLGRLMKAGKAEQSEEGIHLK